MSSAAIATILSVSISTPAFGAVTDILVKGENNANYQYSIDNLIDSLNSDKKLFEDFKAKGKVVGYYDNKIEKYVSIDKIIDAYNAGKKVNDFTENAEESDTVNVTGDIQTIVEKDGEITEGEVIKPGEEVKEQTVTFNITDGTDAVEDATIVVKDSEGKEIETETAGVYELAAGTYT
ncbi:hypothetical protein, partial [Clostridium faecium]